MILENSIETSFNTENTEAQRTQRKNLTQPYGESSLATKSLCALCLSPCSLCQMRF